MNKIKEKISVAIIVFMMVIILLPAILWLKYGYSDFFDCVTIFILSITSISLIFSFYTFFPRLGALLFSVLAIFSVINCIFILSLNIPISSATLSLLAETNQSELLELLESVPGWVWGIGILIIGAVFFAILFPFQWSKSIYVRIVFYNFMLVGFVAVYFYSTNNIGFALDVTRNVKGKGDAVEKWGQHFSYSTQEKNDTLRIAFPLSLPFIMMDYYYERKEIKAVFDMNKNYSFHAERQSSLKGRQVYILVIGESSRFDHWHINGYKRNTSPYLSARNDIISFSKMYTYFPLSRLAIPVLVTRRPVDYQRLYFDQASIVTYFKQIGFETAWISLQAPVGAHDSPISVSAYEADNVFFLNPANYTAKGIKDYEAISKILKVIDSTNRDMFIVVSTLGSHFQYKHRYDDSLRVFTPDRKPDGGAENLFSYDDQVYFVNAYDNSIVATDLFLQRLIEGLERLQTSSWMFYISDHGQGLLDDGALKVGHGQLSFATTHVPAFFWASPQYIKGNQQKVYALEKNAKEITSNNMVFETLVSLSDGVLPDPRPHLDMTKEELVVPSAIKAMIEKLCEQTPNIIRKSEASERFLREECQ